MKDNIFTDPFNDKDEQSEPSIFEESSSMHSDEYYFRQAAKLFRFEDNSNEQESSADFEVESESIFDSQEDLNQSKTSENIDLLMRQSPLREHMNDDADLLISEKVQEKLNDMKSYCYGYIQEEKEKSRLKIQRAQRFISSLDRNYKSYEEVANPENVKSQTEEILKEMNETLKIEEAFLDELIKWEESLDL